MFQGISLQCSLRYVKYTRLLKVFNNATMFTTVSMVTFEGLGHGFKETQKQEIVGVASEDDGANHTHSVSSADIDMEGDTENEGVTGGRDQDSPEMTVRARFAFTGDGDDEVILNNC